MRIAVDLQGAQTVQHGERGIPRYILQYARAVENHHPGAVDAWMLEPSLPVPAGAERLLAGGRVVRRPERTQEPPELYHVLSPFERGNAPLRAIVPRWAQDRRTRLVVTLYDLIPLIYAEQYLTTPSARLQYHSRLELIRHADHVLAISEATARDAVRLLGIDPRRVTVAGTGVDEQFRVARDRSAALARAQLALPGLRPGYVMYTGGIDFRKNIDGLLTGYALLPHAIRAAHQLVLVCRMSAAEMERIAERADSLGIGDQLLTPGYVPDEVLVRLYQGAELFVFPSLYEGFGLPVAEAMACGTPTIVSNNSSLIDLVPVEEARFDATSPTSIATAMFDALTDDELRARLQRATVSGDHAWALVAQRTLDVYDRVLAQPRPPARRPRPRIAFVSPMPPAESGVADYSRHLVAALGELADVDVFAQPGATHEPLAGVRWFTYGQFRVASHAHAAYDRVIACMGNSTHHLDIWDLLDDHRVEVIAHDVRMTGFMEAARALRPELVPERYHGVLDHYCRRSLPGHLAAAPAVDVESYYRFNDLMVGELIRRSERVWVHSRYAAALAQLDADHDQAGKVAVLPFGVVSRLRAGTGADTRADTGVDADSDTGGAHAPLIVSMGIVHHTKQSLKLCQAVLKLLDRVPGLRCAFVGTLLDDEAKQLPELVAAHGAQDRIVFTGRVDAEEYDAWLAAADVAVQLREVSNGETSAAVADCLGAAVPVVVSDVGSNIEFDADTVAHVPRDIDASTLADTLAALLEDPDRLAALGEAGYDYARARSFGRVAAELLGAQP